MSETSCVCGSMDCRIPFGLCHCGCGKPTRIAKRNRLAYKHKKGSPIPYIHGHHSTQERPDVYSLDEFKIDGEPCRLVALTQGYFAIVDSSRFEEIAAFNWSPKKERGKVYAARNMKFNGKWVSMSMHRQIMGLAPSDPRQVDHKEPMCTLDNRLANLRLADHYGQMRNRYVMPSSTTGLKGVGPCPKGTTYRARIMINGKRVHLGTRPTAMQAYLELYVPAAIKHFGEFARF